MAKLLRLSSTLTSTILPRKLDHWVSHPRKPYSGRPPRRVRHKIDVRQADLSGWPVYEVSPKSVAPDALRGHVLYLHGGAYVLDIIPALHWPAIAKIATTLQRTVTVPIYPLAPEHTYREVYPFLLDVYRQVLQTHHPKSVAFMGESAGGGLALGLCHALRAAGLPQPGDALLLSPWLHAALPDPGVAAVAAVDPILSPSVLREAARHYAGGASLDDPLISPSTVPLSGLPRISILTGTHEVLNPDARAFRRRANAEGVELGWYELDGGIHAWMFLPVGRNARDAWDYIRTTVDEQAGEVR
ncbi:MULTISPECIES: alpha/beta hydrolase fold domain-containing protein [Mycolicibacter]|uniref:Alpha/beta hydrolase n=1 Tax=Mycolicibacter kumamotonensis TaxID=354243 RepID=A0A7K3L7B5_9MYCO|nr:MULTISPECIES: alpha/beta hydrolase [Mycolicibacter]NDJ88020.1 alpha/beta hydrolase [Mycolicibacter kumamotonensis]RAV02863.1 hypothetical protein DQP56_04505 [Mycolicibacter senuensis]